MKRKISKINRKATLVFAGLLAGIILSSVQKPVLARPIDWPVKPVSIAVQDQPLTRFLQDFFAAVGHPVLLSEAVDGNISGQFTASPENIFNNVVHAYGLVPYFDGTAMHIATSAELQSDTIKLPRTQIEKLVSSLVTRELVNDHQTIEVHSEAGLVEIRGAPQFVVDVRKLASALRPKPRKTSTLKPPVGNTSQQIPQNIAQALIFRTFDLRFASAADTVFVQDGRQVVLPGVATLLRNMVGDGYSPRAIGQVYGMPRNSTVPKLKGGGLGRYRVNNPQQQTPPVDHGMLSATTHRPSQVRIEAEPNINAVIIRDYPDAMPLYESLIKRLDVEPNLVEIQVTIVDIDKNKLQDLGVNWRYDSDDTSALLGGGQVLQQDGGLILNTVLGSARKFFANVNALANQGSAKVVSRPQIVTVSNLEAVLANDQTFFVRVAGDREVDLFNVSVGTSLRVVPNVVGDPHDPKIRLLVTIEDGSIDAQSTVDDIPVIERSSLTTQAIIYNGESLLIGGLVRENNATTTRKVPLLGDVPAVGRLFRRDVTIETQSERLFLISPKLINSSRAKPRDSIPPAASPAVYRPANRPATETTYRVPASSGQAGYLDGF